MNPELTLKGEAFVVTNSSQNIRLGRLKIRIYEADTLKRYLETWDAQFKVMQSKLNDESTRTETALLRAKQAEEGDRALADARRGTFEEEKTQKAAEGAANQVHKLAIALADIRRELNNLYSGEPFVQTLPAAGKLVRTDSNGKYLVNAAFFNQ